MTFLMLVCRDESIEFTPQDRQSIGPEVQAWVSELEERGVRLQGDVLAPVNATTTISVRGGETRVDRVIYLDSRRRWLWRELGCGSDPDPRRATA